MLTTKTASESLGADAARGDVLQPSAERGRTMNLESTGSGSRFLSSLASMMALTTVGAAPVIVDFTAARLQGKDTGTGSRRSPRVPLEHQRDLDRFSHAIGLLPAAPRQAMDSLMLETKLEVWATL